MSSSEDRLAALEAWREEHEAEHKNLRDNLEAELRSKWGSDILAQSRHIDGELHKQNLELANIKSETERQTPILRVAVKRLGASAKERRRRKEAEDLYRKWIKRAVTVAVGLGALLEFIARVLPALR